ncbi:MAG: ABC transporter permease [Pelotomaculum sp.]
MSLFLFSIRNAFRKKTVAALAILGVAFGCALMTFLLAITNGMENRVAGTFNSLYGRITITQKGSILGGLLQGIGSSAIPDSYIELVESVPHVYNVTGQLTGILRPAGSTMVMPVFGYGSSVTGAGDQPFQCIIEGRAPVGTDEVIIGKSMQEYLTFTNTSYITGGSYAFEVSGTANRTKDLKVVGVYRTGNELLDSGFSSTEELVREIGRLQPGKLSAISAQVDSIENLEGAIQQIEQRLAGKKPEVQLSTPREMLLPLQNVSDMLSRFFLAVSLVAVLAGSLSIMVVLLFSVLERKREFGILKALGWTPRNIAAMVLAESVVLSFSGAVLGVALGYAGLTAAKNSLSIDIGTLDWPLAAAVVACGVLVGAVGGLYPAWRANRSAPAEIMRGV